MLVARDPVSSVDTIRTDNERSARELAEHLVAHGHRRFAFVGDPDDSPDVAGRYAGFAAGLRAVGVAVPAPVRCAFDIEAGRAAAGALLRRRTRPQVVVCANDEVALGVHTAATDAGLTVPDDLAVTGWDDVMAARFAGLTTVRQPMRELGATAAHWLHDRITEGGSDRSRPRAAVRSQVLPTQLTVRRSCGTHPLGGRQDDNASAVGHRRGARRGLGARRLRPRLRRRRRRRAAGFRGQGKRRDHGMGDGDRG
ncbi:LacI family DNA-binding transcriptional regulator [Phytohabitans flavus]|uniref:LacI family DNA-binding transcriptional regulator n=1 Tax=Phytohabitans flavus TaxID=1076124 RepID=UPI00362ADA0D